MNTARTNGGLVTVGLPKKRFADHSVNGVWGYTYFARRGETIKIGHTGAPKQRFYGLGKDIEVLAVVPNTIISEGDAHRKFAHLRVAGEWFWAGPDLLEFIEHVKKEAAKMPPENQRLAPTFTPEQYKAIRTPLLGQLRAEKDMARKERISVVISNIDTLQRPQSEEHRAALKHSLKHNLDRISA